MNVSPSWWAIGVTRRSSSIYNQATRFLPATVISDSSEESARVLRRGRWSDGADHRSAPNSETLWSLEQVSDTTTEGLPIRDEAIELVRLPGGEFKMGSTQGLPLETPVHSVVIQRPLLLGKLPVTQGQWTDVMDTYPSTNLPCRPQTPESLGTIRPAR